MFFEDITRLDLIYWSILSFGILVINFREAEEYTSMRLECINSISFNVAANLILLNF